MISDTLSSRIGFLLGAGASIDAELPSSLELTERVSDSFRHLAQEKKAFDYVVAALIYHKTANGRSPFKKLNIEEVYAAIRFLANRQSVDATAFVRQWANEIDALERPQIGGAEFNRPDKALKALGEKVEYQIQNSRQNRIGLKRDFEAAGKGIDEYMTQKFGSFDKELFERTAKHVVEIVKRILFLEDKSENRVSYLFPLVTSPTLTKQSIIFTLNYDRSIEVACRHNNIPVHFDGIDMDSTSSINDSVKLVKLHGSIDWFSPPIDKNKPWQFNSKGILISNANSEVAIPFNYEPAMVFGRGQKMVSPGVFLDLIRFFDKSLQEIQKLIVIGYSFGDDHINYHLDKWLVLNQSATMNFVVPSAFQHEQNYLSFDLFKRKRGERVTWHQSTAKAFLSNPVNLETL